MKIIAGYLSLATLNKVFINLSLSPNHFDIKEEALKLKKLMSLISLATALAIIVFPFPGGPYKRIAFEGVRIPLNN